MRRSVFDTKGKYIEGDDFVAGERGEFPLIVKRMV